jgi:hypothetical protein
MRATSKPSRGTLQLSIEKAVDLEGHRRRVAIYRRSRLTTTWVAVPSFDSLRDLAFVTTSSPAQWTNLWNRVQRLGAIRGKIRTRGIGFWRLAR